MEQKESKTNKHFIISLIKSLIRMMAFCGFMLIPNNNILQVSGGLLMVAELLGIIEEF
jgi:hypothetical protein